MINPTFTTSQNKNACSFQSIVNMKCSSKSWFPDIRIRLVEFVHVWVAIGIMTKN